MKLVYIAYTFNCSSNYIGTIINNDLERSPESLNCSNGFLFRSQFLILQLPFISFDGPLLLYGNILGLQCLESLLQFAQLLLLFGVHLINHFEFILCESQYYQSPNTIIIILLAFGIYLPFGHIGVVLLDPVFAFSFHFKLFLKDIRHLFCI